MNFIAFFSLLVFKINVIYSINFNELPIFYNQDDKIVCRNELTGEELDW